MERYVCLAVLFFGVVIPPAVLNRIDSEAAKSSAVAEDLALGEAHEALVRARRWRAQRILRDYLPAQPETRAVTLRLEPGLPATAAEARSRAFALPSTPVLRVWQARAEAREPARLGAYLELEPDTGEIDAGIELVRRADGLATKGDAAGALEAYDAANELLPQLADWLAIRAAEVAAGRGDTAETRRRLSALDPEFALEWGWPIQVRARRSAGDLAGAASAAVAAANSLADAASRAAAWSVAGDIRRIRGDHAGARAAYRRAIGASPGSAGALTGARMLGTVSDATPRDRLLAGRVYLRHGNLTRGIAGLRAFLGAGAGTEAERLDVRLELGRALARAGKYAEAEPIFRVLADSAPVVRVRADALFEIGRAHYQQGRDALGRATFLELARRFPDEMAAGEALFLIADLEHDRGALEAARRHYETAASIHPDSERAARAIMRLGGLAFADRDYAAAARIFDVYREHHPYGSGFQQSSYWAGRAYLALGDSTLGEQRLREAWLADPFSFYGLRAADLTGQDFWDAPIEVSPPRSPRLEAAIDNAFARVELLRALGWRSAAEFELQRVRRYYAGVDGALYALAEAYNERGQIFDGVRLGWEIYRQENVWNPRLLRIIYPFPFRELITAEARKRGLDPHLVAGLIRQESMFQPAIRSHAGAVGLMQIMPATGRSLARTAGISAFDSSMLERPEVNVRLGILYLEKLLGSYENRAIAALAAYNAGPGRVARWRSFPEWMDEDLFAERIPYNETREYVKVVRRNAQVYAALYPASSPEPTMSD